MGLESRDWYREEPSKAWRELWQTPSRQPRATGGRTTRGPIRVHHGAWLAMLASFGLTLAAWHWHVGPSLLLGTGNSRAPAPAARTPSSQHHSTIPSPGKTVRLAARPGLDVLATTVTRWQVADPRFGQVSVYVPVGQTPREALTAAIAARGYQVVP